MSRRESRPQGGFVAGLASYWQHSIRRRPDPGPPPRQALPHLRYQLHMSQNSSSGPPSHRASYKPDGDGASDTGTPDAAPARLQHSFSQSTLQTVSPTQSTAVRRPSDSHARHGADSAPLRQVRIPARRSHSPIPSHTPWLVTCRPSCSPARSRAVQPCRCVCASHVVRVGGLRACRGTPWPKRQTRPDPVEQPAQGVRHPEPLVGGEPHTSGPRRAARAGRPTWPAGCRSRSPRHRFWPVCPSPRLCIPCRTWPCQPFDGYRLVPPWSIYGRLPARQRHAAAGRVWPVPAPASGRRIRRRIRCAWSVRLTLVSAWRAPPSNGYIVAPLPIRC